jgi:hypothetical protein
MNQQVDLQEALRRQRVKYIVSSYQLDQPDQHQFDAVLELLLTEYPTPLIELAIAETLVANWLTVPLPKGCAFLSQTQDYLRVWQACIDRSRENRGERDLAESDNREANKDNRRSEILDETLGETFAEVHLWCSLTAHQFQQITGLDPTPIFGSNSQHEDPAIQVF